MRIPELSEEKHGRLEGGALTEEVLDSSRSVLGHSRSKSSPVRGLQQWFTPQKIASFIAAVIGRSTPTIDFTAGHGAMLAAFAAGSRFGVEIDGDHVNDSYLHIHGDAQKAVPMLRAAGVTFPAVAINPPFGLDWRDALHAGGNTNSTKLAFLWSLDILHTCGQGAMLCGRGRLDREILALPESRSIYAIVDIEGQIWDGVEVPCSIAFFAHPSHMQRGWKREDRIRLRSTIDDLMHVARDIVRQREFAAHYISGYASSGTLADIKRDFTAVSREYARRKRIQQEKSKKPRHDLSLKGKKISAHPSAFGKLALNRAGILREVELLNGQHVNYFASNPRAWRTAQGAERAGHITIADSLKNRVAEVMDDIERVSTPLFPLKPQMRLGWLTELDRITCRKDDPAKGFTAGEVYDLATESVIHSEQSQRIIENKEGEQELRQFVSERRLLQVRIETGDGKPQKFNETPDEIRYLIEHFDIPDPGHVASRFPARVASMRKLLEDIEAENAFTLKDFQKDHMSRLLTKERGLLAHEQGLGKTLMLMTLAEASIRLGKAAGGAKERALFVVPQDLIPQWQREAKKFFGRELEEIRSAGQARRVAKRLENGGTGWFITYYEALSIVGRKREKLPEKPLDHRTHLHQRLAERKREKERRKDSYRKYRGLHEEEWPDSSPKEENAATSKWACPKCLTDTAHGWDGEVCRECHYIHRKLLSKPAYAHLGKAFIDGVVCVDELSEIRGDDSLRSKAIRALSRGKWNFGGTGTPLSNYINDAFWGLWFALGNASAAFPYDYSGGKAKFEQDFCVVEYMMGRKKDGEDHVRKRRKILPKVTNVSQFWRLTQPGVSRCRKEHTGEPLVPRIFHPIRVPMGVSQKEMHHFWLSNFEGYFREKNPHHPLVEAGMVEKFAAALGQLWRLEHAATMPKEDVPTSEWDRSRYSKWAKGLSNWTPATLKVLEIAIEHAEKGEKVLIGSDLITTGKWLSDQLNSKGVKSVHLVEEKAGQIATKNPRKRSKEVTEFVEGDAQVMCAGVNAMKLGHNMDLASCVIVHGLPYSHMVMDQFIARVHRMTSKKPVNVYVVIPNGSLAEQKWQLLKDKGGASDLAFDGELAIQQEEAVNWSKVLKDMKLRGIRASGDEVIEADVREEWRKLRYRPKVVEAVPSTFARTETPSAAKPSPQSQPKVITTIEEWRLKHEAHSAKKKRGSSKKEVCHLQAALF